MVWLFLKTIHRPLSSVPASGRNPCFNGVPFQTDNQTTISETKGSATSTTQPQSSGQKVDSQTDVPDPAKIPANQSVKLSVKNIQAFLGHEWSVTYYNNDTYSVEWQMRIGKSTVYIGPSILHTNDKTYIGAKLSGAY